jgi:biotin carboxyl carrier protein
MRDVIVQVLGESVPCSVLREGEDLIIRVRGAEHRLRLTPVGPGTFLLTTAGRSRPVYAAKGEIHRFVHVDGVTVEYAVGPAEDAPRAGGPGAQRTEPASADLTTPMPGLVTQVLVHEGDPVTPGQPLVIVEAMKMEHVIRASRPGVVRAVRVRAGEQVEGGTLVAEIGPPSSPRSRRSTGQR